MADIALPDPSALEGDDPYERAAQTFPTLSEAMAARIAAYGQVETLKTGDFVFQRGQRGVDFFLVLEGSLEIFEIDEHDAPQVFATHHARQFSGEMDLFNDRQILVSGRAGEPSKVVRVRRATSAAWSPPSRISARSSCAPSSCAGWASSATPTAG